MKYCFACHSTTCRHVRAAAAFFIFLAVMSLNAYADEHMNYRRAMKAHLMSHSRMGQKHKRAGMRAALKAKKLPQAK